jgi:hypothetical protein
MLCRPGARPDFMGPASLGREVGIFRGFLYSFILLNTILGVDSLGLALLLPQVGSGPASARRRRALPSDRRPPRDDEPDRAHRA